jgi:hypothetical protein
MTEAHKRAIEEYQRVKNLPHDQPLLPSLLPEPAFGYSGRLLGQPGTKHQPGMRGHSDPEISEIKEQL